MRAPHIGQVATSYVSGGHFVCSVISGGKTRGTVVAPKSAEKVDRSGQVSSVAVQPARAVAEEGPIHLYSFDPLGPPVEGDRDLESR